MRWQLVALLMTSAVFAVTSAQGISIVWQRNQSQIKTDNLSHTFLSRSTIVVARGRWCQRLTGHLSKDFPKKSRQIVDEILKI